MNDQAGSTNWFNVLRQVNYLVCVVMAAAATYLLDPTIADLGVALSPDRTALIGVFLLYTAFVLGFATRYPTASSGNAFADIFLLFVVGSIPLMALGGLQLAFAAQALFVSEPPNLFIALLGIPGVLSFAAMVFVDIEKKRAEISANDDPSTTSDAGKVDVRRGVVANFLFGAVFAAYMAVFVLWLTVGIWLYYRLQGLMFEGATFDLQAFGDELDDLFHRMLPTAVGVLIAVVVVVPAIGIVTVLLQWISHRGARRANRDLSVQEIEFIETSEAAVRAYAERQGYTRYVWTYNLAYLVLLLFMMGLALLLGLSTGAGADVPAGSESAGGLRLYFQDVGPSLVVLVFAGILWTSLPAMVISRLSRRYSERAAWISLATNEAYLTVRGRLTTFVRTDRLSRVNAFDPGRFLHETSLSFEPYFFYPTVAVTLFAGYLLFLDRNNYDLLTEDNIEVVEYWSLEKIQFGYDDVERVELTCYFDKKGNAQTGYELFLPQGHTVDIFEKMDLKTRLAAYEAVDRKLVDARVPFKFATRKPWFEAESYAYDPACVETLTRDLDSTARDRAKRLFRLADWQPLS